MKKQEKNMKKIALTILVGFFALPTVLYASDEYTIAKVFAVRDAIGDKPTGIFNSHPELGGMITLKKDEQSLIMSSGTLVFTDKMGRSRLIIGMHSKTGSPGIMFLDENKKVVKSIFIEE
jgi:hypothetical protein